MPISVLRPPRIVEVIVQCLGTDSEPKPLGYRKAARKSLGGG